MASPASNIHAALLGLGPAGRRALARAIARDSLTRELTYAGDDGRHKIIPLSPVPAVLRRRDVDYLRGVVATLAGAFVKVAAARARDPELAAMLPVEEEEAEWLALGPPPGKGLPVVARWDLNIDPDAVRSAQLFEMNGCAVGGIHYAGQAADIVLEHLAPLVDGTRLTAPAPLRDVWLSLLGKRGRARPALAWLEDKTWEGGITEGPSLVAELERGGRRAVVADPREVEWRRGRPRAAGVPVDVLYRSLELRDLVELEREGADLRGLRRAFEHGCVASPPAGDLDHKSLLEVWSSRRFAGRFSAAERAVLRRHVPWTRLLTARRTDGPDGRAVDLPEFARRHRRHLVIKPNRSCGGDGILIGSDTPVTRWERAIAAALSGRRQAVVQALIASARLRVPGGRPYTTYGLLSGPRRVAFLGRVAPFKVVNVARGGALMAVLIT